MVHYHHLHRDYWHYHTWQILKLHKVRGLEAYSAGAQEIDPLSLGAWDTSGYLWRFLRIPEDSMRFLEILKPGLWGKSLGFWGIPFSKAFSLLLNPLYTQYQLLIIQRNHLGCSRCSLLNLFGVWSEYAVGTYFDVGKKTIYSPPHSLACRVKFVKQFIPSLTPVLCVTIFFCYFLNFDLQLGFYFGLWLVFLLLKHRRELPHVSK